MSTKILQDIQKEIKQLITHITGFKENEAGFRTCEKFALNRINSHAYPTVNAQETKKQIADYIDKISIHGKEDVARKFRQLVDTFLQSFDFERHPQSDLQWSLLTFLLHLSSEIRNASVTNLNQSFSLNETSSSRENDTEEIDWAQYLKEGQEEFFQDYGSDDESEWSDDDEIDGQNEEFEDNQSSPSEEARIEQVERTSKTELAIHRPKDETNSLVVQHSWWNELDWNQCEVVSKFSSASFCDFWRKHIIKSSQIIGTVNEYKVIRELIWMLICPSQMVIFQKGEKSNFFVRDNVTIPSLTIIAFKEILQPYCEYFSMIDELERFGKNLYKSRAELNIGLVNKDLPLTFETYNAALINHLLEFKRQVIALERKIMKQDRINTLVTISADLKNLLYKIKVLYKVHKTVTDDLFVTSNENAVSKLLSGLYFHIESAVNKEEMYIYTSLYLSSITVYLNIIDEWMSEGRLEDWRDEFLISRNTIDLRSEEECQSERFYVKPVNPTYPMDPLIKIILDKVSQMGRNIDLLVTLERTSELWNSSDEKNGVRTSLSEEFLENLLSELSEYVNEENSKSEFAEKMDIDQIDLNQVPEDDISHAVAKQLLPMDNLFLLAAFGKFLPFPPISKESDWVDGESQSKETNDDKYQRLKKLLNPVVPMRKIIEQTLLRIFDKKYGKTSQLVKDILMNEYKLEEHLKLMRCIYMMESSHILNKFIFQFFSQVESNSAWKNSVVLTRNLEEILLEKWPETSSRWSISIETLKTNQILQAIDNINLHYAIDWPINMLLNDAALAKYNTVFKFHLKLKWAHWTLSNLNFSDFEGSRCKKFNNHIQYFNVRRLESLRFWLLHAFSSIQSYLCGQVLQSLAYILENALTQVKDLDAIIILHNEFLDKVYEHCLQTEQFASLREIINNLLEMCIQIRNKWNRGFKSLSNNDLDNFEKNYVKYHTNLILALYNAAVIDENSDSLTILKSAFTCSMPET